MRYAICLLPRGSADEVLEVNAYGKSQSVAADSDGFALERRVRMTLKAEGGAAVAQVGGEPVIRREAQACRGPELACAPGRTCFRRHPPAYDSA